ncbi:MAG: hypothetical protein ABIS86_12415 [Streptosporangiaceae bacterium]
MQNSEVVRACSDGYLNQDRAAAIRLKTGGTYRNTEVITVRGGRVAQVQVFFGGRVDTA